MPSNADAAECSRFNARPYLTSDGLRRASGPMLDEIAGAFGLCAPWACTLTVFVCRIQTNGIGMLGYVATAVGQGTCSVRGGVNKGCYGRCVLGRAR